MSAVNYQGWVSSMNAWLNTPGQDTQANKDAIRSQAKAIGVDPGDIGDAGSAPPPYTASAKDPSPPPYTASAAAPPPYESGDIDGPGPAKTAPPQKAAYVAPATPAQGPESPQNAGGGDFSTDAQTRKNTPEETKAFATKLVDHLQKELGITKNQAVGIVGNLMHESAGLNPGMNQGMRIGEPSKNMADDNGNGYGLAQWGGVRKQGLIDLAAKEGIPASSEKANVDYLVHELKGDYSGVIDALKTTKSVQAATESIASNYEKPSDPQMQSRLDYANQIA